MVRQFGESVVQRISSGEGLYTAAAGGADVAKYKQMLRMGLPRGAVEQRMAADGLDAALLDAPDALTPPDEGGPAPGGVRPHEEKVPMNGGGGVGQR